MAVFGPNNLFILGVIKTFGTHISERQLVCICFLVGYGVKWARVAHIWPNMTNNAYFGPNLAFFEPKILIFWGRSKSFGPHISERHLVPIFLSGMGPHGPQRPIFGVRILAKKTILPMGRLLPYKWRPFLLLDPSQYLFSCSSNVHFSAEVHFLLKIFTRSHCGTRARRVLRTRAG